MHMPRSAIVSLLLLLTALFALPAAAADPDWWGRKLPDLPSQFIFGYGSLINTPSRNSTAGAPVAAIPVRVSAAFGYVRAWNDRSSSGFTALGLRKPAAGEKAGTINGVLYPVGGDDMTRFDARESGYVRVEVPRAQIEPVSWQRLPQDGHIWVYVPVRTGLPPGEGLPLPDGRFPLLQSYIDVVLEGCLEHSPDYARELIETTADWSQFWLNDRELARRPWVHDTRYSIVDALLAKTAPSSAQLANRLFMVQYAVRWGGKVE
jgi:hypothetical protein